MDTSKIANEFQLIDPALITFSPTFGSKDLQATLNGFQYKVEPVGNLLIKNDQVVHVTYTTNNPNASDWIGAYSPALTNVSQHVPVKFAYADMDPDYLKNGRGNLTFNFTNLRSDISFYYFTNGLHHPIAQATTVDKPELYVDFENYNEPLRPRVVPTGDYNVYNLLWSTNSSTSPMVKWGVKTGVYTNSAAATTSSITRDDVCGGFHSRAVGIGWHNTGLIHTAPLVGMSSLPAGSTIYYVFGDETIPNGLSREYVFNVPPQPGAVMNRPTTAILYCDLGRGGSDDAETWYAYGMASINTTMSAGALISQGAVDVVFHGGDISYAVGYLTVWDFFLDQLSPVASRALYLTTVGNHESDWPLSASLFNTTDSGGECGQMNFNLLPMPKAATANAPYWSYEVGLIHFVGMSTEHNFTECTAQYDFLEQDLRSVDRTKTPWIIFQGHRPMYVSSTFSGPVTSDVTVMDQLVRNIEPLLFKYRVNAAFWGHNHVFQRQSALYNFTVVQKSHVGLNIDGETAAIYDSPQATVQILIGNAGAAFSDNSLVPPPVWNEVTAQFYGYSVVKAYNATYLTWDTIDACTVGGDKVMDRVVLTQDPAVTEWKLPNSPAFNAMPPPSTTVCSSSPVQPPAAPDAPASTGHTATFYAIVSSVSVLALIAIGVGYWYYRRSTAKYHNINSDVKSSLKNPLIVETAE